MTCSSSSAASPKKALLTERLVYSLVYEPEARHQVGLGLPVADRVFQDDDLLNVPRADLLADGKLLVLDRFDIQPDGTRLGFEDIAAVMQLRVRERLSSRKYSGSYEDVATALRLVCSEPGPALHRFFALLVLGMLLRNGDAHLKNFAVQYDDQRMWLSPVYDQVTTVLYTYERPGGIESVDRTMALKLRRGGRSGEKPLHAVIRPAQNWKPLAALSAAFTTRLPQSSKVARP